MPSPTHDIVIVTRGRPGPLARILACIAAQTRPPDGVIVVDASDAPADPFPALRAAYPEMRLRYVPASPGLARQRNQGLDASEADIVTFLDDDVEIPPSYCATVLARFARDTDRSVAAVGGCMRNARLRPLPERVFRTLFLLQTGGGPNRWRASGMPDTGPGGPSERLCDVLASTALSVRRRAAAGLRFDEDATAGARLGLDTGRCFGEDILFTEALARRGLLVTLPDAAFDHCESPDSREDTRTTQALYVLSLRVISERRTRGLLRRLARLWALTGQGLLCALQAARYRDTGYLRGYALAMRARLRTTRE
jgi:glycosyltransferase involved in cell wall biosynthesis